MTATLAGTPDVLDALRGVKFGVGNRALKSALGKQANKATKVAKQGVKVQRTGLLAKSIGAIWRPRKKDGQGGAYVVGPRKSFSGRVEGKPSKFTQFWRRQVLRKTGQALRRPKLSKKIVRKFQGLFVDPVRYAHLVEGGRKATKPVKKQVMSDGNTIWGKTADRIRPQPFMKPALAVVNTNEIAADLKAGISREAAKYAAKGKSIYGTPGG